MKLIDLFNELKNVFGNLWQTKSRGKTLEIITPYVTTNNKFISVFLSKYGDEYVVSDGGWIYSGMYDVIPGNDAWFTKLLLHFQESFEIKETQNASGIPYYYVKADNKIDIASKLLDLIMFIQNIVSISEVTIHKKERSNLFSSETNNFLKSILEHTKINFNKPLDSEYADIKFNATYHKNTESIFVMNYVFGNTQNQIKENFNKTFTYFNLIAYFQVSKNINKKITIIDDSSNAFNLKKNLAMINLLKDDKNTLIVNWSEKEYLKEILN